MPIYEFYSPDTNKIYSFFARNLSASSATPRCPDDPNARMQRLVSRFAVTGRRKQEETKEGEEQPVNPRFEKVMAEMEREMAGMDENNPDPRVLGRLMRKMTEATGRKVPEEMEHMLRRLESGEDPEKLEEEFGDALDEIGEEAFGFEDLASEEEERRPLKAVTRQIPQRDPVLYEMSDYLE